MKPKLRTLAAALAIATAPMLAFAQTTTDPTTTPPAPTTTITTTTTTSNAGQTNVATRMASNFTNLAGGQTNAVALVTALRTGNEVTFTTTVGSPRAKARMSATSRSIA